MTPADPPVGAVTTRWPRAFSSDPASAYADDDADAALRLVLVVHRALVDVAGLGLQLDRPGQRAVRRRRGPT